MEIYDTHCFCSSGVGARTNNSLAVSISGVTVKKNDLMRKLEIFIRKKTKIRILYGDSCDDDGDDDDGGGDDGDDK